MCFHAREMRFLGGMKEFFIYVPRKDSWLVQVFGSSHTPFKRGGEAVGEGFNRYAKQFHSLDIAASCSEETRELPFYLCFQSTLRRAGQWKCSFRTLQKFRSIAGKGGQEVLKASTPVETRSIHQSLFARPESLPSSDECPCPVFSSLAVIFLTHSFSLCFMLISSFHSRRWKIMLLFI